MRSVLAKAIIVVILIILILPLSEIATKKRVIIIENYSNSPNQYSELPQSSEKNAETTTAIILGIPGEGNDAPNLTDTLMVTSINEKTSEGFLLSIPRDLWVKVPEKNFYTKINAVYQDFGLDVLKNILSEITGLKFDYSAVVDLSGVKQVIDQVGGIDVYVEKDIYDSAFPGPNNSYQVFALNKGWQHLDGETALKYVRTRHDTWGDFARMGRQQQVLAALKQKITSFHPIWNLGVILSIWRAVMSHVSTNISLLNIKTFWQIAKEIDLEKIKFEALDQTTELLVPDHVFIGNQEAYILKPKAGQDNYEEIKNFIKTLLP